MILTLLLSCAADPDVLACKDACDIVFVECADFFEEPDVHACYAECRQSSWAGGFAEQVVDIAESNYFPCGVLVGNDAYQSPCYPLEACE